MAQKITITWKISDSFYLYYSRNPIVTQSVRRGNPLFPKDIIELIRINDIQFHLKMTDISGAFFKFPIIQLTKLVENISARRWSSRSNLWIIFFTGAAGNSIYLLHETCNNDYFLKWSVIVLARTRKIIEKVTVICNLESHFDTRAHELQRTQIIQDRWV